MPTVFNENLYDTIKEISESEGFNFDNSYEPEILSDLVDSVLEAKELEDDFAYIPESVNLFWDEKSSSYLVEMEDLVKYMDTCRVSDINSAISSIAEANNISSNSISLLIESEDYFDELISEAKNAGPKEKKKKYKEVHNATKFIKNAFNKGITVKKKKSKKPFKLSFDGIAKKKKKGKK